MKINRIAIAIATTGLMVWSAAASATWQDGNGVVFFPSTNKEKIIYWSFANPDTGERSNSTSATAYNNQLNTIEPSKPDRNYVPAGYKPAYHYKIADGKALSSTPVTAVDTVWKAVGRTNNPLVCPPGAPCGEIAMVVGSDQCSSREINLSLGLDGVWKKSPIKYLEQFASAISGGGALGTSTCTNKSTAYTCYANNNRTLTYSTSTYATVETRGRWGYAKLTPDNGEIFVSPADNTQNTFWNLCRAAGGSYYENDFTEKCMNVKNKVSWEEYDVWPLANQPTVNTCRVIKANP